MKIRDLRRRKVLLVFMAAVAHSFTIRLGIWLSKARNAPFLILDVEGTDGRERGEDQVIKILNFFEDYGQLYAYLFY